MYTSCQVFLLNSVYCLSKIYVNFLMVFRKNFNGSLHNIYNYFYNLIINYNDLQSRISGCVLFLKQL